MLFYVTLTDDTEIEPCENYNLKHSSQTNPTPPFSLLTAQSSTCKKNTVFYDWKQDSMSVLGLKKYT